jgi:hypothetical protein
LVEDIRGKMLTPKEQYKSAVQIYYSIKAGKKVDFFEPDNASFNVTKKVVNFSKYESYTSVNYRMICIYVAMEKSTINVPMVENFMNFLRAIYTLTEKEVTEAMKFKSLILSYEYQLTKDADIIEAYNISPNELYNKKLISIFGFYWYYYNNPYEINTSILKVKFKEISGIMSLMNDTVRQYIENYHKDTG